MTPPEDSGAEQEPWTYAEVDTWADATLSPEAAVWFRTCREGVPAPIAFQLGYLLGAWDATQSAPTELRACLSWEISRLAPSQRLAVLLVVIQGMPYLDAAYVMGISPEGVRYHIRQAAAAMGVAGVRELRKLLKPD